MPSDRDYEVAPTYDGDGVQATSGIWRGLEWPDPVPLAPPVGYSSGYTLAELIQKTLRETLFKQVIASQGFESPEEADDFDLPDDPLDPLTEYEEHFMPAKAQGKAAPAAEGEAATHPQTSSSATPNSPPERVPAAGEVVSGGHTST